MNNKYQEQMEAIAKIYCTLRPYEYSKRFSQDHQAVYTASGSDCWLVFEDKGNDILQARITDGHGRIQLWDDYNVKDGLIQLKNTECIDLDGTHTVNFNPEQIKLILRFGDYDRNSTDGVFSMLLGQFDDEHERALASDLLKKLGRVPEGVYRDMYDISWKRQDVDGRISLTARMRAAEKRAKEHNADLPCRKCPMRRRRDMSR